MATQTSRLLDRARRRLRDEGDRDLERGTGVEDEYLDRARSYDARRGAQEAGRAAFDTFREDLGRDIKTLRGQQVGMGRLDTGFATDDEDQLVREGVRGLNREISRNALSAESLNLRNQEGLGQYGTAVRDRGLGNVVGQRDELGMMHQAEEERRARQKSSKFGLLGKAAGTFLGPIGSTLADKLASYLS